MAELSKLQFQFYSGGSDMFATDTKKINGVTHSGPIRYIINKQNGSLLGKYRWSIIVEKDVTDAFRASLAHGYGDTEEECFAEIDKWRENILSWLSPAKVRKGKITPKRGVQHKQKWLLKVSYMRSSTRNKSRTASLRETLWWRRLRTLFIRN